MTGRRTLHEALKGPKSSTLCALFSFKFCSDIISGTAGTVDYPMTLLRCDSALVYRGLVAAPSPPPHFALHNDMVTMLN